MKQLVVLLLLLVAACGGGDAKTPVGVDDGRIAKRTTSDAPVVGWLFASVAERTLGPFFSRRSADAAGMTAWLTPAEGSARTVHVVPVDAKGIPRAETIVAKVSIDTTMLVIGPVTGPAPGFALAWTSLTDRGKSLWSVTVDDKGVPRGKTVELTRTNDDIVWIDILPTEHGSLCMWAEETRGGDANLIAAPLSGDGRVHGAATRIAQGVIGWHALPMEHGIGVSTVSAGPPDARPKAQSSPVRDGKPGGFLFFRRLDAEAQQLQPPIAITPRSPTVSGDVEVVRSGARFLFAWTDRSGEEPVVAMASLDDKDVIEAPRKVAEGRGGASLLALVAGPAGPGLMFEAPARRSGDARRIHVSRVNDGLTLERRPFSLEVVGRGQPELAATSTGFAILSTTADCDPDSTACVNAKAVATIMRTDAHAAIVQREPLTFGADPATLAWGLVCESEGCFALAASPGTPSRIRAAAVRPRPTTKAIAAPVQPSAPKDGPRVVDVTAVASGESVVDVATAPLGTSTLVALLSAKPDAGKTDDRRATSFALSTRMVTENGDVSGAVVLAPRALGVGGVALAAAGTPEDGAALAWVSRETGDAEVHVTKLDRNGKRIADVQLTTAKGDASDVTITWASGGWIVAWVDWRDGNGEVYACRVGLDLARRSAEERITRAPGDATDLVAMANGSDVWLAWGDARENPKDGLADVYVAAVKAKDAKRVVDEQRVLATAANSRTPHLATAGDGGVVVAWIEDAPLGAETPGSSGYGAFWARLGADGRPTERPTRLALAGEGTATSVALEGNPLRAIVVRATLDSLSLDAIDLAKAPPVPTSILALDGPPSLDVALSLQAGTVYFNDEGPTLADRRARRARIAWTR